MAQRRMFSKTITNSGKFLKMPATSRLLYYDLGMNADDDGYTEWFTVVRMSGSTEQDLQVLQANGFVKIHDENVLVILDWKENNYLRSDRYVPSKYLEIYRPENERLPFGIPEVDAGKDRLGKDRLGEYTSDFEEFWKIYPKKVGKAKTYMLWKKVSPEDKKKIMLDIPCRLKDDKWKNGYIKDPERYIKNRQWEDEIITRSLSKPVINLNQKHGQ